MFFWHISHNVKFIDSLHVLGHLNLLQSFSWRMSKPEYLWTNRFVHKIIALDTYKILTPVRIDRYSINKTFALSQRSMSKRLINNTEEKGKNPGNYIIFLHANKIFNIWHCKIIILCSHLLSYYLDAIIFFFPQSWSILQVFFFRLTYWDIINVDNYTNIVTHGLP